MKFYRIDDIDGFFETVNKCKGRVELVTGEGDRLNLKSQLSKYVSLVKFCSDSKGINEMEIMTSEQEDMDKLIKFCITR